ncbi:putative bifunctional UDP-N-acetylmuramoylalanyl-D-glutamate--2,6-diaminopimelate ligase/UDP-N-acetylmuramoyl-tripeptide:D-alanyl-D-alanine ligase [compost metagenome]
MTDFVYTYGPLSVHIAEAAKERFGNERVLAFTDKSELTAVLIEKSSSKDIVLFKGSRGMRLEEVLQSLNKEIKET